MKDIYLFIYHEIRTTRYTSKNMMWKKRKYTKIHKKYIRLSSNYNNVINVFVDETTVVVDLIKLSVVALMPAACAVCCCRLLFFAAGSSVGEAYTGSRDITSLDSFVQLKLNIVQPEACRPFVCFNCYMCFYACTRPVDEAGGIMFSTCACVVYRCTWLPWWRHYPMASSLCFKCLFVSYISK